MKNILLLVLLFFSTTVFANTVHVMENRVVAYLDVPHWGVSWGNLVKVEFFGLSESADQQIDALNLDFTKFYVCEISGRFAKIRTEVVVYKVYSANECLEVSREDFLGSIKDQFGN